jgi:hypothetical protein
MLRLVVIMLRLINYDRLNMFVVSRETGRSVSFFYV